VREIGSVCMRERERANGTVGFSNRVTALISRNGDLVSGMTLEVTLPNVTTAAAAGANARWVNNVGHYLMSQVEVEIGGQLIDRHYDDWPLTTLRIDLIRVLNLYA
jgi:hypothetical protein